MQTRMRPVISVRLFQEDKCFGPGIADLLSRVRELRSLRAAASSMGMAYSKAWRVVREIERALGIKLLISATGGPKGGGASLTPDAEKLLAAYAAYTDALRIEANRLFHEVFLKELS